METSKKEILAFRGEYDFLSNFYGAKINYRGLCFLNNEAAFQAQKCQKEEDKAQFVNLTGAQAKRKGRQVKLCEHWDEKRLVVMEEIVRTKFEQHPELASKLLSTGDLPLLEGNTWHDTFWGVDMKTKKGQNHLGKILMKVREELKQK